jgi:hypothetical protein
MCISDHFVSANGANWVVFVSGYALRLGATTVDSFMISDTDVNGEWPDVNEPELQQMIQVMSVSTHT